MPTYEYKCSAGHRFERFQRMSEAAIDRCPECGEPAERLLSAGAGLLFKGSGFYITDYRSDAYRKAAAADTGESKPAEGSKSGGSKSDGPKSDGPKSDGSTTTGSSPKSEGSATGESTSKRDTGGGSKKDTGGRTSGQGG